MCLKFEPAEQKVIQTCSGKCKNRCGLKIRPGQTDPITFTNKSSDIKFQSVPYRPETSEDSPFKSTAR